MSRRSGARCAFAGSLLAVFSCMAVAAPTAARSEGDSTIRSWRPYPEERPTPADLGDPRLVGLSATGFFDPLGVRPDFTGLIPEGPEEPLAPAGASRYHLVQFLGPVTSEVWRDVRASRLRAVAYVRNRALVVGVPPGVPDAALRALPGVRSVGPFLAGYKLAPALFRLLRGPAHTEADDPAAGAAAPETLSIEVELFPGEDPDALLHVLEKFLGPWGVRPGFVWRGGADAPSRVVFDVPVPRLAPAVGLFLHAPTVAYVQELLPLKLHNDNAVWTGQSYDRANGPSEAREPDPKPYTGSATVWNHGLFGTGQIVAVADTELEYGTCFWNDPARPVVPQQVTPPGALTLDTAHRKILAVNGVNSFTLNHDDTFRHGTHVAATALGDNLAHLAGGSSAGHDHGDGMAPAAKLIFEDIGGPKDSSCLATIWVSSVEDLLVQEHNAGARISTNSWGDTRAVQVDRVVWGREDFLVFLSAGNSGTSGIIQIAASKNSVVVGASENYDADFVDQFGILDPENMAAFSSVGPAPDGRVKPDIVAPGYRTFSNKFPTQHTSDMSQCSPGNPDIEVCFPSFGGCYLTDTSQTCFVDSLLGTSMSTPTAAGLAALARQYFTDGFYPSGQANAPDARAPSAALLKAVLLNGARNMTGHRYERRGTTKTDFGPLADAPSEVQGWGRVMLDDALYFAGDARRLKLRDVAKASGLSTGQTASLELAVTASDQPLEVTLVWTDPPAASYVSAALVNDLDLQLDAPGGTVYRGNQWTADDINIPGDKESLLNPPGRDALNNVEGIRIRMPQTGAYRATVRATDVPGYQGVLTQGYALVVTGAVADPAGTAPDGAGVPGTPLTVDKASGSDITLSWGASCRTADADYEIYEGALGDFTSQIPRFCTTGGATTKTFTPAAASSYYLAVPRSRDGEGSYGADSGGAERPQAPGACLPRAIGPCG